MAGPKLVTVCDNELTQHGDLGSNFYLHEEDVGKHTRGEACIGKLKELNEYVRVDLHQGEINTDFLSNFDIVCFTDCYDKEFLIKMNDFCRSREKPIGFIWTGNLGLYGWAFVDYGDEHIVHDKDGEECLQTIITSISNDENSIVTVNDDKRHGFQDGDWVTFREVEGMTEVNDQKFKIKVLGPFSFSIGDTSKFGKYSRQGIAEQVKVPIPVKFKSLADALSHPLAEGEREMIDADMDFMNPLKPAQYHFLLNQVLEWFSSHKKLPELLNEKEAAEFEAECEKKLQEKKSKMAEENTSTNPADKVESLPEKLAKRLALFSRCNVSPKASLWGGIVAQEIVKHTGKYNPIRPWFFYENFSFVLPEDDSKLDREVDENNRYRDQIALFGRDFQKKLHDLKVFMVGAGALGCEYMKLYSLMGVACGDGKIEVTDDDNIEVSNLNRQFLFRKEHVGSSKAKTAAHIAQTVNKDLKVNAKKNRVSPENEPLFTDAFWDEQDIVVGAVDNVHARQYVDERCVFHCKPLFESGTLGTKCNSQMVIPFQTESYGDSQDPHEEAGIPMCTLRNAPYLLDHTIEWARNYFQAMFVDGSIDFKRFIRDPAGYIKQEKDKNAKNAGPLKDKLQVLKKIFALYSDKLTSQALVNFSRQLFQDIFHDQISQLLHCFPRDARDDKGNLYWSSPKRPPYEIDFDPKDEMHFNFIKSVCQIMGSCFGIEFKESDGSIEEMLKHAVFTVKTPVDTQMNLEGGEHNKGSAEEEQKTIDTLVAIIDPG